MDCIHGDPESPMLYIDPETCIDCGACVAACPVEAIYPDSDVPQRWQPYIEINAAFYEKEKTA